MTMRLLALAFVLFAASPCCAAEAPGRYTMNAVGDSVWRLDSATGAMSVCGQKLDHWACESVADDSLALKAEVDRLSRENRELKDKLAKAEEKEADAGPLPANPSTQFPGLALDEMTDFVNKMIRRLQDLVRDLKQHEAGQPL
ncbi:hypothetical protein [Methyloceanibacter sp.]|uniref:hypothetical protein n=1 Tax=Methyloceanibacter sp. TaxID=1965321 RepID=UPI003D6D4211